MQYNNWQIDQQSVRYIYTRNILSYATLKRYKQEQETHI